MRLTVLNFLSRTQLERNADWLAIAVAASLPWSTSATSILVVLWLLALFPTLDVGAVRQAILSPEGGLPVALFALGAIGMLWGNTTLAERVHGIDSFFKLLMVPILIVQFQRSERGFQVLKAFLASCVVLLIASYIVYLWPQMPGKLSRDSGVFVKNYIAQSAEFMICAFTLMPVIFSSIKSRRFNCAALGFLLVAGFLADMFFVATSRTELVIFPIFALLLGSRLFGVKGFLIGAVGAIIVFTAVWMASGYLRDRVNNVFREANLYQTENIETSTGERLEFWKKSVGFITEAPIIGHGTGSIRTMFRRASEGTSGVSSEVAANPHNQTFAVAIQLGLVGTGVLWAMWIAHLMVFRGTGLISWIGLVVVVQNIVGSLFNSHLFDFTEGWIYVFGVSVIAGMARRQSSIELAGQLAPVAVTSRGQ